MFARILALVVAGWFTAGVAVFLLQKFFPKEHMDALAGVAVVLGLVVAVVVWRATRPWVPRPATEAELTQGFDVHLGSNLVALMILLGLVSFGIFALLFWWFARRLPRKLDPEGMTLRNGQRLAWRDVAAVRQTQVIRGGVPVGHRWEVVAGPVQAVIVPAYLAEGKAVLEFLGRVLGPNLAIK